MREIDICKQPDRFFTHLEKSDNSSLLVILRKITSLSRNSLPRGCKK